MGDVSLGELRRDPAGVVSRAAAGERVTVHVDSQPVAQIVPIDARETWVSSGVMERRFRAAQADATLRDELREFLPDAVGEN